MEEIIYSEEVQNARKSGLPVVALESTIISHGMPFPQNFEVAAAVESTVRNNGAVPATIAIIEGRLRVGLDVSDLKKFAELKNVMKCSRRDIPFAVTSKLNGATTVAGTMIIAALAGIRVLATGGIGGVHRMAEQTFDISTDLTELGRTNLAVVSAGAKAILDIPKTLEYLETLGIPVIGFNTDDFPAFYTRSSGLPVPMRMNTASEISAFLKSKWEMGIEGGVLIANPIPEAHQMDQFFIESAIRASILEAGIKEVSGKKLTPFLLGHLNEITDGKSQNANRALVLNNAVLAAQIAVSFCR